MTPPTVATARDLVALGYPRRTAYRMLARAAETQHVEGLPQVVTAPSPTGRGPRRVRALALGAGL